MDKRLATGGVLVLALATGLIVLSGDEREAAPTDDVVRASMLAVLPDGGRAYTVRVRVDGGEVERVVRGAPGCVRKLPGRDCRYVDPIAGRARDFGDFNRFAADAAVGTQCQPVACVVSDGDADGDESEKVARLRDAGAIEAVEVVR